MKKVHYSILIPDEVEVVSIEINLKSKAPETMGIGKHRIISNG